MTETKSHSFHKKSYGLLPPEPTARTRTHKVTLTVAWDSKQWDLKAHNHAAIRNKNCACWHWAHPRNKRGRNKRGRNEQKQQAGKAEGRITLPKKILAQNCTKWNWRQKLNPWPSLWILRWLQSQNDPVWIPQHQTTQWEERKTTA